MEETLIGKIVPDNNYDNHSKKYEELTELDPSKKWVQYPESMRLVGEQLGGDFKGKKILDMGCANGKFTRMMALRGAEIVGYDPSKNEVQEAQRVEKKHPLGIKYFVSDRPEIDPDYKFDAVTAVLVLPLMDNEEKMSQLFSYAYESLKSGGKFIILTINPNFKRFNEILYNRRFKKIGGGNKYILDFFDNKKNLKFSVNGSQFSEDQYKKAAIGSGFKDIEWKKLKIDPKGIKEQGKDFWDKYEEDCPYIGIITYKN